MKPNRMPKSLIIILTASLALAGCFDQGTPSLDKDDIRFAGFYSDYLQTSGVSPVTAEETPLVLASSDVRVLLARHNLDPVRFDRKMALYRRDPDRWRLVLEQVRLHIRQKEAGGE
ncbi:MAG: hypothetical protein HGA70_06860 [Chlorobiaceae bacterium]|nr:hypothetical protein [Chlorobiaceae bacterium]NTW11351.1 hypothetical protein [Chlorobiaceae bacterium]